MTTLSQSQKTQQHIKTLNRSSSDAVKDHGPANPSCRRVKDGGPRWTVHYIYGVGKGHN